MKYFKSVMLIFLLPVLAQAQDARADQMPSISFVGGSVKLNNSAKALLQSAAERIKGNPESKIIVKGYCGSSKREVQLSWDRVNNVINYLIEKEGINYERLIFQYGEDAGDCNTVDLKTAGPGVEGPHTVPAPHPNLRRRN